MIVKSESGTRIATRAINDTQLSAGALATLTYLMGKPESWNPTATDIAQRFHCDRRTAQRYLDDLVQAGYAKQGELAYRNGKRTHEYTVSDDPSYISICTKNAHIRYSLPQRAVDSAAGKCVRSLQAYLDMFSLHPDVPTYTIRPQIKALIRSDISSDVFAAFAMSWLHEQPTDKPMSLQQFIQAAFETLTGDDLHNGTERQAPQIPDRSRGLDIEVTDEADVDRADARR